MAVTSRHAPQTHGAPLQTQAKVAGGGSHIHQVASRGDAGLRARETSRGDGQLGQRRARCASRTRSSLPVFSGVTLMS